MRAQERRASTAAKGAADASRPPRCAVLILRRTDIAPAWEGGRCRRRETARAGTGRKYCEVPRWHSSGRAAYVLRPRRPIPPGAGASQPGASVDHSLPASDHRVRQRFRGASELPNLRGAGGLPQRQLGFQPRTSMWVICASGCRRPVSTSQPRTAAATSPPAASTLSFHSAASNPPAPCPAPGLAP